MDLGRLRVKDVMSTSAVVIRKGETVGEAIAEMRRKKVREIPIVDGSVPVGLVSYTTLVTRRSVPLSARIETVMMPSPRLDEDTRVTDAAEALMSVGIRGAPVVRDGKIVGFVSRTDIVRALAEDNRCKNERLRNLMTSDPISVGPEDTVKKAVTLMDSLNEKALPVVDRKGAIIGVVGMTEIVDSVWRPKALKPPRTPKRPRRVFGDREPAKVTVGSIMTRTPISVSADDTVSRAASLMLEHGIATVFVQEHGKLVGVVSQADLMELVMGLRTKDGMYVQISGLDTRDPFTYEMLDLMISKAGQKIARVDAPRVLSIHATSYHKEGGRTKYSLKGRLTTKSGLHHVKSTEWDLLTAADALLDRLVKSVVSKRRRLQKKTRRGPGRAS